MEEKILLGKDSAPEGAEFVILPSFAMKAVAELNAAAFGLGVFTGQVEIPVEGVLGGPRCVHQLLVTGSWGGVTHLGCAHCEYTEDAY